MVNIILRMLSNRKDLTSPYWHCTFTTSLEISLYSYHPLQHCHCYLRIKLLLGEHSSAEPFIFHSSLLCIHGFHPKHYDLLRFLFRIVFKDTMPYIVHLLKLNHTYNLIYSKITAVGEERMVWSTKNSYCWGCGTLQLCHIRLSFPIMG